MRIVPRARTVAALALGITLASSIHANAQSHDARVLGREEILLYGIGLKVEPAHQTVPKDIATIVSTFLQAPTLPEGAPAFAADAEVRATLTGPSFTTPQELRAQVNTPFHIPPLTVPGTHTLENIRLVSGSEVLLRGVPEQVTIEVIERLLVTQVTARALTAAEIREKGIVFDASNFQAYNFSAAFAIEDRKVEINFPVVLPTLQGARDVQLGQVSLPAIAPPTMPVLQTIIPDTLKLQTQIPNLSVVGFTLEVPQLKGKDFVVPPIPAVIVIPGDIGFLNQYFSVLLMVGNVAPVGSGLVVSDLRAEIVLPPGRDTVVGSDDDPLRMARTTAGESPRVQIVVQPGPDGKLGTGDDVGTLGPGENGNAEYLVEGRREGSHVIEMELSGTLHGLPVGPVEIRGRAAGSVLVRNPRFTLTFTHPEVVNAGEPYTLDITVTNTGESPANFVQLALYPRNVSGAAIVGEPTRQIESLLPGDSGTVSFDLISRLTGRVTAATLDSDEKVAGRFELKTAIGELGVPLSPDSLVLPKEAGSLPRSVRDAALGLLGKAYAVATAPGAALPKDVRRFSRKVVWDRAVEVAEAGFRHTLREPLADSVAQLAMDFLGSNYPRLAQLVKPEDLAFERDNYAGFDELRRRSVRGDVFASAVAGMLAGGFASNGASAFHYQLAEKWSYRPGHVSVLVASSGPLPVALSIHDAAGKRVGGVEPSGKIVKEIPFGDFMALPDANGTTVAQIAVIAAPDPGGYTIRVDRTGAPDVPYSLSVVLPTAEGHLRQYVFDSLLETDTLSARLIPATDPFPAPPQGDAAVGFDLVVSGEAGEGLSPSSSAVVVDPAPSIISAIQQRDADVISCGEDSPAFPVGRVIAVLFSEEVSRASVQDKLTPEQITHYLPEGNRAVGVALQPGRRIAFIALRDPIGPFVERQITIQDVADLRGQVMTPFTGRMETTVGPEAGVVNGRVLRPDGTAIPFANVRLFYLLECDEKPVWIGIASKSADAEGRYSWDYVLRTLPDKVVAVDVETEESRSVPFNIQRDGQRLNVDVVFLGRGTFKGTTRSETGGLLRNTAIRVTSLTDSSEYGATTDENGQFVVPRIPVGNIFVEAINTAAKAKFAFSELIPFAGAVVDRNITLLDVVQREITVEHGQVRGHVLQTNGTSPAPGVPVFVWYKHLSQPGVRCPGDPPPAECAVAGGHTDEQGAFSFADVPAGELRISTFDQEGLLQGEARLVLAAEATVDVNVLLVGGLGTVRGRVLDPDGSPVVGATVGGGLSLATTNSNGEFTLPDVPVGKREIVAISQAQLSSARATIDLARDGDTVHVTLVLTAVGSVSGKVVHADGVTPAPNVKVYLFKRSEDGIEVLGEATTNDQGGYRINGVRPDEYTVSAFNATFTDGNVAPVVVKYHQQVFRADVRFRGGAGGRVVGTVFDDDGVTPLKATVSISGEQVVIAGGRVGVGFQWVDHFAVADTDFTTGRFNLGGAWIGKVTVSAAGQFSPDPIAVDSEIPTPGATVEVNLRLQPTSQIRGVVLQPEGVRPVGRSVIVRYKSDEFRLICDGADECVEIPQGIQEETVVTDDDGRFWLPIVNGGSFTLTVEDPVTGKTGQVKGSVRAGDTAHVDVRLLGLGELTVTVLGSDAVTAIPGARVVVKQLGHPGKRVEGVVDTAGTITFVGADGFSEGDLVIEATDQRNGFAGRGSARITEDGEQVHARVYLYDAAGSVYGRVYASDGLTTVANAEIVISNSGGPLAFSITGVDGSYEVALIPLGDFSVEVFEARTARRGAGSGRIDSPGQRVPINITQASLGVVKGVVADSTTFAPLKGWRVALNQRSQSGVGLPSLQTTTGIDGLFLFPGASRGTFTLFARHDEVAGSASASGPIEREGEVIDVPLLVKIIRPLAGTIAGSVLTPTGAPAPNTAIEICHDKRPCTNPVLLTADATGEFALADAPLGRFKVTARSQTTSDAGTASGELAFDGDIASVRVILGGLSEIRGTVERANGMPAAGVQVVLTGVPDTGCGPRCVLFTDDAGTFVFRDVSARTFTVNVTDPVHAAEGGAAGGGLNPGEVKVLRIVLAPSFRLTGRATLPGGRAASGIVAELVLGPEERLYAESDAGGTVVFPAVRPGTFQLFLSDPIASGVASRSVTVTGDVFLGDILLDVAPPMVADSDPAPAATGVAREQPITITFSEPVRPGTVNADNVSLAGPSGAIVGTLDVTGNDTIVTLTPLAPLADQTRYTLRVRNVVDRVGKTMPADYVATFTTVDVRPPAIAEASPAPGTGGAPIYAPVRVKFSEPIDPARFSGAAITLTGPAGVVAGRIDFLLGNSVIVFTPNVPLFEDAAYSVVVQAATDIAGNRQPEAATYQFTTTDRTPPQLAGLTAPPSVVENGVATVIADVGTTHDVAVVDWYINDVLSLADRSAPFALNFQAIAAYGGPGSRLRISAIATDTSGNRGDPGAIEIAVTPDQPPSVEILSPANGLAARNGDRIVVNVRATDDLGIQRIGYRANTGAPTDALSRPVSPVASPHTESFTFYVPADAAPGSTIAVNASAADTKNQFAETAVSITVLDATPPVVTITGATTGARVLPGQQTTIVLTATDIGGVASVRFTSTGVATFAETRTIDPARASLVTSFTVTVPTTARPGQTLTLGAIATDAAGNSTTAASVVLPVADTVRPTIALAPESGNLNAVAGRSVNVVATAEDEPALVRIDLATEGAVAFADAKQVTPPRGSASLVFSIPVPETTEPGSTIQVRAMAVDSSNNVSAPAFLTLTVIAPLQVSLPASQIIAAGEQRDVVVELSEPAPAGGVRLDFTTADATVAMVTPFVTIAEGQTAASITVSGVAGGTTQIRALVQGVQRASMTVTVQGGIVSGIVRDSQLNPVAGVQLTITSGFVRLSAITDADGRYRVDGIPGQLVEVRALDPVTRLYGRATAAMAHSFGYATVNVILIPAGSIHGKVYQPDGTTAAGASVRVEIFSTGSSTPLATAFTDEQSAYEFPLVTLGNYRIDATALDGNRGRSQASLTESGQDADVNVVFLGYGTVSGTVRSGGGAAVPNAEITFRSWSVLGGAPEIRTNANPDGTYTIANVAIGSFSVVARNATGQAGSATGTIVRHAQAVTADVQLSSYATVEGRILRPDGVTVVAGATVSIVGPGFWQTETDADGRYRFEVLPLGSYLLTVSDPGTRGKARGQVTLSVHEEIRTVDLTLHGQGRLLISVRDAAGDPVGSAFVSVNVSSGSLSDYLTATTGADGRALVEHVLAGSFTADASFGPRRGSTTGTLAEGALLEVTISLEPTASISGTVFEPDGQTPAAGARITILPTNQQLHAGEDGVFRIDGLRLGRYDVFVYDAQNRLRAHTDFTNQADDFVLTTNGQVATRDFTLIGLGTVTGQVVNPGSTAQNMHVQLWAHAQGFQQTRGATTNAAGFYEIEHVPAGDFTVTVSDRTRHLYGEQTGRITRHGEIVQADIVLTNNAITLPRNVYDANNFVFDLQENGSVRTGSNSIYAGDSTANRGAFLLDVTASGTTTRFAGGEVPTGEDGDRETVVRQENVGGLSVTRKIFVPRTGYFARFLEILRNPTEAPIAAGLAIVANFPGNNVQVRGTSTGDTTLSVTDPAAADRWVALDRSSQPVVAFVFDGAGAPMRAAHASLAPGSPSYTQLRYGWNGITIAPGQTVAFLHFGVQQLTSVAAIAAAERLALMPPEALTGLSAEELASVENFVLPEDGASDVAPLPLLTGVVTGVLYEGDGTSRLAGGNVRLTSGHVLFGRTLVGSANSEGAFIFTGEFNDTGSSRPVPLFDFSVTATHPSTAVVSASYGGNFDAGAVTTTRDITFSNTGIVHGSVLRHTGAAVSTGSVSLTGSGLPAHGVGASIRSDASYRITGVPAGLFQITATLPHPQGTALSGVQSVDVAAAQVHLVDITVEPTGTVRGVVRDGAGALASNVNVRLERAGFSRFARTDTGGAFLLADVPSGQFTLRATEPRTDVSTSAVVQVAVDQTTTTDLQLVAVGSVEVRVAYARGGAAAGASVLLTYQGHTRGATTGGDGAALFDAVPAGAFTVTARHPDNFSLSAPASGNVAADGDVVPVAVTLPAAGTVQAQITYANGTAAAGALVELRYGANERRYETTQADGRATFVGIPIGAVTLTATHPASSLATATATANVSADGQTITVPIALPAVGDVQVTVSRPSGAVVPGSSVQLTQGSRTSLGTSDAQGRATFNAVPTGAFSLRATHPARTALTATASGSVSTEGETVPVSVVLPAIGSVTGTVRKADNTVVGGIRVSLRSSHPQVGTLTTFTNAQGVYRLDAVPAGAVEVTVEDLAQGIYGTAAGQLTTDEQLLTLNIQVQSNIAFLPRNLFDGNGFRYDVQRDGTLSDGTNDAYDGGLYLRVYSAGSQYSFPSPSTGLFEEGGREIAIRGTNVGGLDVVRKIFVPVEGYFARYIEALRNPGATAVTIDVEIATNLGSDSETQLVATSSGDQTFAADDRWLVTDDSDGSRDPSMAHVFGGVGARRAVTTVTRSGDNLSYRWNSITIEPGQTVALMHFALQHFTRRSVQAAAERVVQLPQEAIAGLSAEEVAAIETFAVPADGSSTLPELRKPQTGTVTGRVYASDGSTAVPSAQVTFTSENLIFGNVRTATASSTGSFTVTNAIVDAFTLKARHPQTGVESPLFNGTFAEGQTSVALDVVFSNTGMIRGTVRRHTGVVVTSGQINTPYFTPLTNGAYSLSGLVANTYVVTALMPVASPQWGSGLVGTTTAVVTVGETTTADVTLPPTGDVAGIVLNGAGQPAASVQVNLQNADWSLSRSIYTNNLGEFRFTDVPSGDVIVSAYEPSTFVLTSAPATVVQDQTTTVELRLIGLGSVAGRVTYPDGSAAPSSYVELQSESAVYFGRSVYTDSNGNYTLSNIPVGHRFTVRVRPPDIWNLWRETSGHELTAHGQELTLNFTIHARATVRVHIRDAAGAALPGAQVLLKRSGDCCFNWYGYTNASGYLDVMNVPEGEFAARTDYPGAGAVIRTGTIAAADHGRIVEITLTPPLTANLEGHVYAGDGQTAVPYAYLEVYDGQGQFRTYTYADETGAYNVTAYVDDGRFRLVAYSPVDTSRAEYTGQISTSGETVTIDLTLPLSIVRGTVTNHDGTAVPWPSIFATAATTYYANWNDEFGRYLILGVPVGPFRLVAQNGDGLTASVDGAVENIATPVVLDLALPPTVQVEGSVRDADGTALVDRTVVLTSPGLTSNRFAYTDGAGHYTFSSVPAGVFTVQACVYREWQICGDATGQGTTAGETVIADIRLPATGTVVARLRTAAGDAVTNGYVRIDGVNRTFSTGLVGVDAQGEVRFQDVPDGTLRLSAESELGYGIAEATLVAGGTLTVDITIGNALPFDVDLAAADGFRYDVRCNGALGDGGTADGQLSDAYDTAYQLSIGGYDMPCVALAGTEQDGRELVLGPVSPVITVGEGGETNNPAVRATRKIFVPLAGGFARYLELVTNTTNVAQTVTVEIRGNYGPGDSEVQVAVASSDTGGTYAVMRDTTVPDVETSPRPVIAHVFAGPGASVPVALASVATGRDEFAYSWNVTIGAGQTVGLLHFAIQRAPDDTAGATAQAEALANMTDPAALEALSAAEKAAVVNFAPLPGSQPLLHGTIDGTVYAADGSTPIAGANVYAVDVASGRVIASMQTGSDARYRFENLYAAAGVTVMAVAPLDPEISAERSAVFAVPGDVFADLDITLPLGMLSGTVRAPDAVTPVAHPRVLLAPADGAAVTRTATFSRSDGTYAFIGLPQGDLLVTVIDPATSIAAQQQVSVPARDSLLTLDFQLASAAACVPPPGGLVSWWRGEGDAVDAVHSGNTGAILGGVSSVPGFVGQALAFDGVDDRIEIGHQRELNPPQLSVETWVQFTSLDAPTAPEWPAQPGEQQIVFKRGRTADDDTREAYALVKTREDGSDRFAFRIGHAWGGRTTVTSATVVEAGRFYHVVATHDGATARLYVDGVLEDTADVPYAIEYADTPLKLGQSGEPSGNAPCNCVIDELKIYERPLTPVEIHSTLAGASAGTCQDLHILSSDLPVAHENHPYTSEIRAIGGVGPVTLTVTEGAPAPGVTLSESGALTGIPTAAGTYTFDVTVTDAIGQTATATFTQSCGGPCLAHPADVVAHWTANDNARDTLGLNNGFVSGATFAAGLNNRAFQFDGVDDAINSSTPALTSVSGSFTIEFWAMPTGERASTVESTGGLSGTSNQRYAVVPEYIGQSTYAGVGVSVGTNGVSVFEHGWHGGYYLPSPLVYDAPVSGWTHIAVVYRNRQPSLYVNGVLARTGLTSNVPVLYPSKTFGSSPYGYGAFEGLLDEVAVYARALSSDEVAAIYNAQGLDRCPLP